MPPGTAQAVLETCLSMAQNDLTQINNLVAQLAAMEADATVSDTAYRQVYLQARGNVPMLCVRLYASQFRQARYIASLWFPSPSDRSFNSATNFRRPFTHFLSGMRLTPAERQAMLKGTGAVRQSLNTYLNNVEFADRGDQVDCYRRDCRCPGCRRRDLRPVTMAVAGGIPGGRQCRLDVFSHPQTTIYREAVLVSSTIKDVSGFTSLDIGLFNVDPVNHKPGFVGSERGWQFGGGFYRHGYLGSGAPERPLRP